MRTSNLLSLTYAVFFAPVLLSAQIDAGEVTDLAGFAFKYSVATSARKSTIWRLWTDVENWKKFDTSLEYSFLADGMSFAEGAVGYLKAEGAPRTKFEILNVNEGESFIVRLRLPLYQTIDQQRYFEVSTAGEITFTHEVNFRGVLSPIVWVLLRGIYKRETRSVVERLKAIAENEIP